MSAPVRKGPPFFAAARIALISAWQVGSFCLRTVLAAAERIAPFRTMTAPKGPPWPRRMLRPAFRAASAKNRAWSAMRPAARVLKFFLQVLDASGQKRERLLFGPGFSLHL